MDRDVIDDLFHYSGAGFVSGALLGGATALGDCLRFGDRGDGLKLRAIQIGNMVSHRGCRAGAYLGALGLLHASLNHGSDHPAARMASAGGSTLALRITVFRSLIAAATVGTVLSHVIFY